MALPDYFKVEPSSTANWIVWGSSGGTGVTNTFILNNLAAGSARMGPIVDLGTPFDDEYLAMLVVETSTTAPTAGGTVELFLVSTFSTSTQFLPAAVTGADGAWPADGNEDEWKLQLGPPVVTLIATADASTIQPQQPVIWRPTGRYVIPVVDNNMSQSIRNEAASSDNASVVVLVPRRFLIQDTT